MYISRTDICHKPFKLFPAKSCPCYSIVHIYFCQKHFRVFLNKIRADLFLDIDGVPPSMPTILSGKPDSVLASFFAQKKGGAQSA